MCPHIPVYKPSSRCTHACRCRHGHAHAHAHAAQKHSLDCQGGSRGGRPNVTPRTPPPSVKWHQLMQSCMWLLTPTPQHNTPPPHAHPHHLEVTGVLLLHGGSPALPSGLLWENKTYKPNITTKRSGSGTTTCARRYICVSWLFSFFSHLHLGRKSGCVRSAILALMRMDVLEMRILYEEVIRDRLFYFFFFSFFILSPSLLLSSHRCVFLHSPPPPRDHLPDNVGSMMQHLTLLLCWCSLWFSRSSLHALDDVVE